MKKPAALLAVLTLLLTWFGVAPAQAVAGTSVTYNALQQGLTDLKLSNTSYTGHTYQQTLNTTRKNVGKTCPPSPRNLYKLRVESINGGYAFLKPGQCREWKTKGNKEVGLFLANYTPPTDPPPPTGDWPTAANTGFQGDVQSLPVRNGWRVTTPGAVIENVRIDASDGALIIDAPNVTVRDVVVDAGIWGIDALGTADGLVIEDSTFIGGLQSGIGLDHPDNWLVQRVNVYGGNDGIKPGGSGTVRDSYIHDLGSIGSDPHNDAMQFGNAWGIDILHNRLECKDTSCIAMFGGQAVFDDVTIDGNLMGGAGYLIYAGGETGTNIRITNNTMGDYGYQHPVTDWDYKPGHVFTGNVYEDGSAVPTPQG